VCRRFFTGADGKKAFEIISPSDRILSVDQISGNEVLIIYQRGPAVTSALFFRSRRGKDQRIGIADAKQQAIAGLHPRILTFDSALIK
jgi:hypothetical protein